MGGPDNPLNARESSSRAGRDIHVGGTVRRGSLGRRESRRASCRRATMASVAGILRLVVRRRPKRRPWPVVLLYWSVVGLWCGVQAQFPPPATGVMPPPGVVSPPGFVLPPPGVVAPPGFVLPPPGTPLLPPPPGDFALPPGYAYPPGYVNPVPPGTPSDVAQQLVYQQLQDMSKNITNRLQDEYSFCISNG